MRQNIAAELLLPLLHQLYIRQHALVLKRLTQLIRDRRRAMQSRQRNKLQHEPFLPEVPDEALQALGREAVAHPVEARGEVVYEFLAWQLRADVGGESGCFLHVRVRRLEPEEVGVGPEGDGALGGRGDAGPVVVVAFAGAGDVARPDDGGLGMLGGELAALGEGEVGVLLYG